MSNQEDERDLAYIKQMTSLFTDALDKLDLGPSGGTESLRNAKKKIQEAQMWARNHIEERETNAGTG